MNPFLHFLKVVKTDTYIMYVFLSSHNLQKPYQIFFQQHLVTESAVDHNSPWYVLYKYKE